jgi:aspartyl protease family protein
MAAIEMREKHPVFIRLAPVLLCFCLVFSAWQSRAAAPDIQVEGLLKDAAIIKVNGERKMLRVGQSFAGVTLVASSATAATVKVDGQNRVMGISRQIGSDYAAPREQLVTIARDARMQYLTNASINGRTLLVMVDTGANVVGMSSDHANALGIDYYDGQQSRVETASGLADAYSVTLRSVSVGGIEVNNVRATVIMGNYPGTVLLGMSYLQHVKLAEHNGILSLSRSQ